MFNIQHNDVTYLQLHLFYSQAKKNKIKQQL